MKTIFNRSRQAGQTLIVALIILFVLLILGLVFLGLVGNNIRVGERAQRRSVATDIAEAGVRYMHALLQRNQYGADYRPPTLAAVNPRDPDYEYLRPGVNVTDLGGPDKLGPYTRLQFDAGRALVRIRYAASDVDLFNANPGGPLRRPGKARNYLMIEAVGKPGRLNPSDPTTLSPMAANSDQLQRNESRKVIAFATIGITDQALFITDKFHVSRPADIGTPSEVASTYLGFNKDDPRNVNPGEDLQNSMVKIAPRLQIGTAAVLYNLSNGAQTALMPALGSIRSNAPVVFHGEVEVNAASDLGDQLLFSDAVIGADNNSALIINRSSIDPARNWAATVPFLTLTNGGGFSGSTGDLNSRSDNFNTGEGIVRDGVRSFDQRNFTRGVGRFEAPSILTADPDTGQDRYRFMSRESGVISASGNDGRFGYGQGVYVNNTDDRQQPADELGREAVGSAQSLVFDWLNPNNGQAGSGWQGAFYVPRGAHVQLNTDGFTIVRDGRAPANQRSWREPDGSPSRRPNGTVIDSSVNRYRIRRVGGQLRIINSYTINPGTGQPIDINNPGASDYQLGPVFNGVLYFEGNVRVRGVIPTDIQMTIVSGATIYIEGSITKGIFDPATGARINRPSQSLLGLFAKDYVAVNTTQFFGPSPFQALEEASASPTAIEYNPLRIRSIGGGLEFLTEFLLDPNTTGGDPANPTTWKPYAMGYVTASASNDPMTANLGVIHTMDNGAAPATFFGIDVDYGVGTGGSPPADRAGYEFPLTASNSATSYYPANYVEPGYTQQDYAPLYGLGAQPWQRYGKFEGIAFPLVSNSFTFNAGPATMVGNTSTPQGLYTLFTQGTSSVDFKSGNIGSSPTNDYLLARASMFPHDVRIEATIFAEEGSFFVIPGSWFNPSANDRRDSFNLAVAAYKASGLSDAQSQTRAELDRRDKFGSFPETPFFGEPIDVRVQIIGGVSENMPPPAGQQAEWMKKWGWIPRRIGSLRDSTGNPLLIPTRHVPNGYNLQGSSYYVPNLIISYDPVLGTGRQNGFTTDPTGATSPYIRTDSFGRPLPPLPRLPVSPTLAYFGEVNP